MVRGAAESSLVQLQVLLMTKLHQQACYLLIIYPTVQVVDKMIQLHKCCAIASSTLLLVCTSCWWIVCVVFLLLQFYVVANELFIQSVHDYTLAHVFNSQLAITVLNTYSTNQHANIIWD